MNYTRTPVAAGNCWRSSLSLGTVVDAEYQNWSSDQYQLIRYRQTMHNVLIIESELGWGQKTVDVLEFPTPEEAEQYVREYNRKHNPPMEHTPDWYMYAKLESDDSYGMMR